MKKTYFYNENTSEWLALYVGIDRVYGGWIEETGGDPITLNDLEDALSQAPDEDTEDAIQKELAFVNATLADPSTPWEPLEPEDEEYIHDTLVAWGILK